MSEHKMSIRDDLKCLAGFPPVAATSRSYSGRTPASLAAEAGHVVILELLYESGADIIKSDNAGFAPGMSTNIQP